MTKIFGHRGASASFPENTLSAFAGAADQGADGVELDVRRTADDVVVVHHDPQLADGRVIVEHDHTDLPENVPTLAQVVEACPGLEVNVEIKSDPSESDFDSAYPVVDLVVDVLHQHELDRFEVSSFDSAALARVLEAEPVVKTGQLTLNGFDPAVWQAVADAGHHAINPHWMTVDEKLVTTCHDLGLAINVWTCDDADAIRRLAGWGIASIIANDPAAARTAMES